MARWQNGSGSGEFERKWKNETGKSGFLDVKKLKTIFGRAKFIKPAADAFEKLINAARKQGFELYPGLGYRDYKTQEAIYWKNGKPNPKAAGPGGSIHGWGRACDLYSNSRGRALTYEDPVYRWLLDNGWKYGIINPPFAVQGGPGPHEAWHWEYIGNGKGDQINIAVSGVTEKEYFDNLASFENKEGLNNSEQSSTIRNEQMSYQSEGSTKLAANFDIEGETSSIKNSENASNSKNALPLDKLIFKFQDEKNQG